MGNVHNQRLPLWSMPEIKKQKIDIGDSKYEAELQIFSKDDQEELKELYQNWKKLKTGLASMKSRHPNLPEGISEGAFALFFDSPRVISVPKATSDSFDNYSMKTKKRIQVKATTVESDLTSFGPKSVWDELWFLDFYRDGKFDGKFDAYKIPNKLIYSQKVNKNETFTDQQKQGRRPRFSIKANIIIPNNIKPEKTCQI